MLACKEAVFDRHRSMFTLYEKYCEETSRKMYWGDDDDSTDSEESVAPADDTNEADCHDGF